ncbi:hypothetical protein J5Y09_18235 [Roseomonas sp. PWR1]|uniref:Uncharacterized protein n=1 Tax=Roseomonas nitratireducens TaxID=2820810 RepID=A0ABS4AWW8_9PROT|nr:hypothetical protein [Neoroseomonas nitratireducens]MBP0465871.1 hypothetical protein [Neoroseomonas nitratireducens]
MTTPQVDPTGVWGCTLAISPEGSIATKVRYGTEPRDETSAPRFLRMTLKPLVLPNEIARLDRLLLRLMDRPDICVLRGAVLPGVDLAKQQRRLLHDRPDEADGRPTMVEVRRQWLALDLDAVEFPAGVDWRTEPGRCAREAANAVLPEWLLDADMIVQFTSGMGFKPTVRIRTWHLLDRPLVREEIMRLLADRTTFDASVLVPVQPIYTARPVFRGGVADPLPGKARAYLFRSKHRLAVVPPIPPMPMRLLTQFSGTAAGLEMSGTVEELLAAMRPMHMGGIGLYESSKKIIARWVRENGAKADANGIIARCVAVAERCGADRAYLVALSGTLPGFARFCAAQQESERDRALDEIARVVGVAARDTASGRSTRADAASATREAVMNDLTRLEGCFSSFVAEKKERA